MTKVQPQPAPGADTLQLPRAEPRITSQLVIPQPVSHSVEQVVRLNEELYRNWNKKDGTGPSDELRAELSRRIKSAICPDGPGDASVHVSQSFTPEGHPISQIEICDQNLNRYGSVRFDHQTKSVTELKTAKDYALQNRLETALKRFVASKQQVVEDYSRCGTDGLPRLGFEDAARFRTELKSAAGIPEHHDIAVTTKSWRTRTEQLTHAVLRVSLADPDNAVTLFEARGVIGQRPKAEISAVGGEILRPKAG